MPTPTLQPNDPQEMPVAALENLIDALNVANEAWRRYATAWGVPTGQNYFGISENKEMQEAIFKSSNAYYLDGFHALFEKAKPRGGVN